MAKQSPITIVECHDHQDLRQVNWNHRSLERTAKNHNLKDGQAVLYRNGAENRWRLVVVLHGMPVLVIPPVEKEHRLSLDLVVSSFIRKFNVSGTVVQGYVNRQIERTEARLKRRQQLAEKAQQGRAKNGQKTKRRVTKKKTKRAA